MAAKSSIDRDGTDAMRLGNLLKALETTSDAKLGAFREQRCPKDSKSDDTRLRHARALLDAIAEALESAEDAPWLRVDAAWRVAVDGVSEARAAADLTKAEAQGTPVTRERRSAPSRGQPSAPSESTPPKPPSVFSLEAPLLDDAPIPERGPSPWVRPTAAGHREESRGACSSPPPPSSGVDETQALDARRLNLEPLPFKGVADAPIPGAALGDLPPMAKGDMDATSVMRGPLLGDETMPFGGFSLRKELAARVALEGRTPAEPAAPPAAKDAEEARGTASGPGLQVVAPVPARIELTLEQFASLCASCDVDRENTAEVERRFGISNDEARRALDADWTARFRCDGALYRTFYGRFHEYRGWLIARRGSPKR